MSRRHLFFQYSKISLIDEKPAKKSQKQDAFFTYSFSFFLMKAADYLIRKGGKRETAED